MKIINSWEKALMFSGNSNNGGYGLVILES